MKLHFMDCQSVSQLLWCDEWHLEKRGCMAHRFVGSMCFDDNNSQHFITDGWKICVLKFEAIRRNQLCTLGAKLFQDLQFG